jgi:WD40 repeat protein
LKCLRKAPAARYGSAQDLADDLGRFLVGEPIRARPIGAGERLWKWTRRRPARALLIALAAASVPLLFFLAWYTERRVSEARSQAALEEQARQADKRIADAELLAAEQQRELQLHQVRQQRVQYPSSGWRDRSLDLIRRAAQVRPDIHLRNQAAATLAGLDARLVSTIEQPGIAAVAFDAAGRRLLFGSRDPGGARLTDLDSLPPPIPYPLHLPYQEDWLQHASPRAKPAPGKPLAFRADGTPLHLELARQDCRWSLRLWDVGHKKLLSTLERSVAEPSEFRTAALSPDGAYVSAAALGPDPDRQGWITVWDAHSGHQIIEFTCRAADLAFSPDHRLLAAGDENGEIHLWALPQGEEVGMLVGERSPILALAFDRNPRRSGGKEKKSAAVCDWLLATGHAGGTVTIWDLEMRSAKAYCRGSDRDVHALAFSPDGALLATAGWGVARFWDVATGRLLLNWSLRRGMTCLAFSSDGRRLAVGFLPHYLHKGGIDVLHVEHGRGLQLLHGLAGAVARVCYSPDGHYLAALSHNWQAAVWDLRSGRLCQVFNTPHGHLASNAALAFSPDNVYFAFCAGEQAKLWDAVNGQELRTWKLPPGLVDRMAFHPSGRLLLFRAETQDGQRYPLSDAPYSQHPRVCRLRDLLGAEPARPLAEIAELNAHVFFTEASLDGSIFAVQGMYDGPKRKRFLVKVFDGPTGKELWSREVFMGDNGGRLVIDPSGGVLAYRANTVDSSQATLVRASTGEPYDFCADIPYALSPQARYWVTAEDACRLFRLGEQTPLIGLGIDKPMISEEARFNRAGTQLAWGNTDGTVTVCDLEQVRRRLEELGLGW